MTKGVAGRGVVSGGVVPPVSPMLAQYLASVPEAPTADQLAAYSEFVSAVPDLIAKRDVIYITCAHSAQAIRTNFKDPAKYYCSIIGSPKIEPGLGVTGTGNNQNKLNTGFLPDGNGLMKSNEAEIDVFVCDNAFDPDFSAIQEMGNENAFIRVLTTALVSGAPNAFQGRMNRNATASASSSIAPKTAIGFSSVCRKTIDGNVCLYRNGQFIVLNGGAFVSYGVNPYHIGGVSDPAAATGSPRRIGFMSAGALLTDAERVRWSDAVTALMTQLGAYNPADMALPPNPAAPDPYAPDPSNVWTTQYAGTELNMAGLTPTHVSDFTNPSALATITQNGGPGLWGAPVRATVGSAPFKGPSDTRSPFAFAENALRIRMEFFNGDFQTGHMQTASLAGEGFSQTKGYFEAKIRMPGAGTFGAWPAFWLYGNELYTNPGKTRPEIDIIEYYPGNDPNGHHSSLHLRPGSPYQTGEVSQHWSKGLYTKQYDIKDGQYHTFGAEVTDDWIIIYQDRKELKRFPTLREFKVPLFMLVSLQMLPSERNRASQVVPIDLFVEYVRVWQRT